MICPAPRHVEHVVTDIIEPRTLRRATLTDPDPRQVGQVSGIRARLCAITAAEVAQAVGAEVDFGLGAENGRGQIDRRHRQDVAASLGTLPWRCGPEQSAVSEHSAQQVFEAPEAAKDVA